MIGVKTMKVRMFDGVVCTLFDVRHMPNLRRSLISVALQENDPITTIYLRHSQDGGCNKEF